MTDILDVLEPADYEFLLGILESPFNLTDDSGLRTLYQTVDWNRTPPDRIELNRKLEHEIRYVGSSEIAYFIRYTTGRPPGVSFGEMVRDVGKSLKVGPLQLSTDREMLKDLVERYVTRQFSDLSAEDQQKMLEELGVERDKAAAFIMKSAGVFALPIMIEVFNAIVVEGLVKRVIFGTIAKIIGKELARRLFSLIAGRFPWWLSWIGPAVWTMSFSWLALDLQGPANRKTIPIVLYLGLCNYRADLQSSAPAD